MIANETELDVGVLVVKVANDRCQASYQRLFTHVAPRLLNFVRKQSNDEQLAKDVVQETMLKVWTKAHLYDKSKGAGLTWIYSIARNAKFDILRRLKHQNDWIQGDDLWPVLEEPRDDEKLPREFEALVSEELRRLIETLPTAQAQVVDLVYLKGSSQQEVADVLGVPLGTVKSRLRLALTKMKEALNG
ncbi:sigma-70 family RNA polymerase sigma factor [Paraferrimonas sedimenticola]|uniref:sigma-70 family RNA polymerase sigma factor n=1 Tax=Paraferrimonas sedimenticola TaxID=375674 RepID=UPI000BA93242|nr:sigma-70 family RNA polymerase sigma factor [Paraferrimonas sedimenticola]